MNEDPLFEGLLALLAVVQDVATLLLHPPHVLHLPLSELLLLLPPQPEAEGLLPVHRDPLQGRARDEGYTR